MTGGPCGHALVGCAAVAMGQIVKFWNFPPRGSGSHSYTHSSLGTISATFNLAYDWANMPNSLTSSSTHADELLFHCGVTLNMNYGIGESSAFSEDVPGALIDHFYYKTTASHKYRSNYTTTSWRNLMIAEINAGRPALYAGHLSGGGGHGWVMDGYNNNTSTIYFHMNWGWGGSEDGWYTVDNLAPGPYNFSVDHKLVIGIEPKQTNLTFLSGSSNMSFNNDNLSISCTVQNNGAASSKSVELGYYIISGSTSRLFDTDAIPVLAPSFTSSQSAFKSIYSSDNAIPPGSHMVGIFVDHLGQENNESNEGDNMLVFPNAITTNCFPPSNVNASDGTYADRVYISWSPVVGANYYKVYRNTTNSTSGAVALTGWQMSTFYQNLSALPGITYYYFVQASTSTSGAYLSPFSSGDAGYVQITNLSDDVSQSVTTDPQYYQVLNSSIYWYAVGVRPNVSTEDWDIYMYSDATMTTSLASSTQGSGRVDVIVVDGNHTPSANKYIKADRYSGSGNATIEYENAGDLLTLNTTHSFAWPTNDVVEIWDVYLPPGTYTFDMDIQSVTADLDFGLFKSNGAAYHAGRNAALASSTSTVLGVDEQFTFTVTTADYYGLCVWSNNGVSCNYTLHIGPAGRWLGTVSNNWHTSANWSGGFIPDLLTDVVISTGYTYYPILQNANGGCRNLTVNAGARLDIGAYDLTVTGNTVIHGSLNLTQSSSDILSSGYIYFESGSTASMVNASKISLEGNLWLKSGSNVQLTSGEILFVGTSNAFISSDENNSKLCHVRAAKTGAVLTINGQDTLFLTGLISFANGCELKMSSTSKPIAISGYINTTGGSMHMDYGDVILLGLSYTSTLQAGDYFNNLVIGQPDVATSIQKTFNSNITINGNLTIHNRILNISNNNIYIKGNWTNNRGSVGFTEGTGQVHFIGSTASDITTDETFYDLILNKTYANFDGLEMTGNIYVTNNLSIQDGTLEINPPCTLNVGKSVTIAAGAGLNADDAGNILINVGNDWYDANATNSATAGFRRGSYSQVRFNGNGVAKNWQYIQTANPFNRLIVATTSSSVYPSNNINCNDLVVESGTFEPYYRNIYVSDSAIFYGNLLMNNTTDTIFANNVVWGAGSGGTITSGAFVVGQRWEFQDGTNAVFGTGNTVFVRGTENYIFWFTNNDNDAAFGNVILDKPGANPAYVYIDDFSIIRVQGNFVLNANNKFRQHQGQLEIDGSIVMDPLAKIRTTGLFGRIEVDGNFTHNGEIEINYGLIEVHGSYNLASTGVLRQNGGSFICDKTYSSAKAFQNLEGKMVMNGGVFEITNNSIFIGSTFIDSISGGEIRSGYSFSATSAGTFQPSGGTVVISGSDKSTTGVPFITLHSGNYFHNLVIDSDGFVPSRTLDSPITIMNDLSILSGTLNAGTYTMNIGRNWNNQAGTAGFLEGTSKVRFFGSSASDILNPETFYNLDLDKSYTNFDALEIMDGDSVTVLNNLSLMDGVLEMNPNAALNVQGNISMALGAGLSANDGNNRIYVGGNWTNLNTGYTTLYGFNPGSDSYVSFQYSTNASLNSSAAMEEFANLNFQGSGAVNFSVNAGLRVLGDLRIFNNTYVKAYEVVEMLGDYTVGDVATLQGFKDIIFTGPFEQNFRSGNSYPNLEGNPIIINKPGTVKMNSSALANDFGIPMTIGNTKAISDTLHSKSLHNAFTPYYTWGVTQVLDGVVNVGSKILTTWRNFHITQNGEVCIGPGGHLKNQGRIGVHSGGMLRANGTAANPANVMSWHGGKMIIGNGGTISAHHTNFSLCCDSSLLISVGGMLDPAYPFSHCSFTPDENPGTAAPATALLTLNNFQSVTIPNASFVSNPLFTSNISNVRKAINNGVAVFKNASGDLAGEAFDDDIYNRVHWVDTMLLTMGPALSLCQGDTAQLWAQVSGGLKPYVFSWSTGTGIINPSDSLAFAKPTATTTYYLTVTDQLGDFVTGNVIITVYPTPIVTATALPPVICQGDTSILNASGANTYIWNQGLGSGASKTVTPSSTTVYVVTGTDINGCKDVDLLYLTVNPLPGVSLNAGVGVICEGESSVLTASGASTYAWSHGLGTGSTKTVTPTATTTYTVTGTAANGCTNTATVEVIVNALPTVTATAVPVTICAGEPSVLSASGASTYAWSHGLGTGSTKTVTPTATTTYTVTGTAANGCTNTASLTVTVNALPTVSASAAPSTICAGESSVLTASGASTYAWSHGLGAGSSKTVTPTATTTYTVTGTAANGCTNTASLTVTVNALPTVSASAAP
ncbi:MAG: C10 family peptidase, partial [Lentimicrobiaceae bacterium]|nr:C10 family peptidase [Lentimicrobiaceae bacterium]